MWLRGSEQDMKWYGWVLIGVLAYYIARSMSGPSKTSAVPQPTGTPMGSGNPLLP
jgi:hypothetical protein